jgi:polar amino acid transport system substrate-binding protein
MKAYLAMLIIVVLSFTLISCSEQQTQENQENSTIDQPKSSNQVTIQTPSVTDEKAPSCAFKIGYDVWEPYQYLDIDNQVKGLDVELISPVIKKIGCKVEFIQGTWVNLLEQFRSGQVDILLGASKTDAREEFAFFSVPYRMEKFELYIRKDDAKRAEYKNINEFIEQGSKIGVVGDYFYGQSISDLLDDEKTAENFVFGIMGELNIARLLDMDIDGFLEDSFVGASMIRRKALGEYIVTHGFTVNTGDIYVMFSRASVNGQRVAEFNAAMTDFKSQATYNQIMKKYGGQ